MELKSADRIELKTVKEAIGKLNATVGLDEGQLIEAKIPVLGKGITKPVIIQSLVDAVLSIDKAGLEIPEDVILVYNGLFTDKEEETKPAEEKKSEKKKTPSERKPPVKSEKSIKRRENLTKLIAKGTMTKADIVKEMDELHPNFSKSTVLTYISDGKNPKYNIFENPVEINADGIVSFAKSKG